MALVSSLASILMKIKFTLIISDFLFILGTWVMVGVALLIARCFHGLALGLPYMTRTMYIVKFSLALICSSLLSITIP